MPAGTRRIAAQVTQLLSTDALVVGGTLGACAAARELARAGRRTVLAARECSLPFEMSVCRRPWVRSGELAALPTPWRALLSACVEGGLGGGEHLLNLARLAARVEEALLDAGVTLFYGMTPCGLVRAAKGAPAGVLFGGKFGLCAIAAETLLDCTPDAALVAAAGGRVYSRVKDRAVVHLSCKVNQAADGDPLTLDRGQRCESPTKWPDARELRPSGVAALTGGRVPLHGPFAEFILRLPFAPESPLRDSRLAVAARRAVLDVGAAVAADRAAAGKERLFFHRFGDGLLTEPLVRIAGAPGNPFRSRGFRNLFVLGPAADVPDSAARRLWSPCHAAREAVRLAARLSKVRIRASAHGSDVASPAGAGQGVSIRRLHFQDAPPLHAVGTLPLADGSLPVLAQCDTLVVGAGTSGVPAALAAAHFGGRTILIEQHADVGGTRTIGGVGSYWFGRETPFQRACDEAYDRVSRRCAVAEETAMLAALVEAGVEVLPLSSVAGVLCEGRRVTGVAVAAGGRLGVIRARAVVDATGDADLAAWAGAPFEYGNGRDAWTLWASFADFNGPKRTASRMYESGIETRDPWDFARTILRSRGRPGMWNRLPHEMPQHYVAPRESRRVAGRARVTYAGILAGETFPDVMVVCDANFDLKGIATSDLLCSGVVWSWGVCRRYLAAIPYGAIVPRSVENLLVAGRAYSATHDAMSLARMQRDMASLGAAAGTAAALAAQQRVSPGRLDAETLQAEWVRRGILRAEDRRRWGRLPERYGRGEAAEDARRVARGGREWPRAAARLARHPAAALPALRGAFRPARKGPSGLRIGRLLCALGDGGPVSFLLDNTAQRTATRLPPPRRRTLRVPPEHGWAPEPAYSLYAVGLAGAGARAAEVMTRLARRIPDDAALYADPKRSPFEYVRTICAVAERCPGVALRAPLEELLRKSSLRNQDVSFTRDVRRANDPVAERRAWLEMAIGRALARCGDARGLDILRRYRDDVRGPLARSAEEELRDLAAAGFAKTIPWKRRID